MKTLIDNGLDKTEKQAETKNKIKEGMQPIKNIQAFVAKAVKVEPTAAVAWAGITTFMEVRSIRIMLIILSLILCSLGHYQSCLRTRH